MRPVPVLVGLVIFFSYFKKQRAYKVRWKGDERDAYHVVYHRRKKREYYVYR